MGAVTVGGAAVIVTVAGPSFVLSTLEVAVSLAILTIKTHMTLAYRKLKVSNAVDAVLKARELGFID